MATTLPNTFKIRIDGGDLVCNKNTVKFENIRFLNKGKWAFS